MKMLFTKQIFQQKQLKKAMLKLFTQMQMEKTILEIDNETK